MKDTVYSSPGQVVYKFLFFIHVKRLHYLLEISIGGRRIQIHYLKVQGVGFGLVPVVFIEVCFTMH